MIESCLLCHEPLDFLAVYAPADQKAVRAPAGKTRTILYALCSACQQLPDAPQRCERRIQEELAQAGPRRN
jgi:hypothetical protein